MALTQYMQDMIGEKTGDQCGCIRARHGRAGGVSGSGATVLGLGGPWEAIGFGLSHMKSHYYVLSSCFEQQ